MKTVFLQFDLLADLAAFSKTVNDRGYVIIIKDLMLQCGLTDTELETALKQHSARLVSVRKVAA
jgi:hypothetical protein